MNKRTPRVVPIHPRRNALVELWSIDRVLSKFLHLQQARPSNPALPGMLHTTLPSLSFPTQMIPRLVTFNCGTYLEALPHLNSFTKSTDARLTKTIKPQTGQDYADVTFIQIPGSEYSLRFWPGSFHWAEYCVDFVDAITGKPMNVPQKYEIWKIPDPEDKPWLVSVVAKMESIEKLYGINDPLPGEEKFILRDGMACQLALRVKKGEVDSEDNVKSVPLFRFRVPKHVPERSRAADVRSIPSESDSGSSDEYDNDADTSSSGEGSSCSGEDSNDELYPELGEATGYRDNIMRTPQAWRFTQQ
ncbi:hypothetical protein C8Q70DRAFT_1073607 [Cubamyces menziesii]|nr:hypothetical protein C8Q70DRAFT_1073607 [Cubamyces menziesii]